jgi:hypothetical protein
VSTSPGLRVAHPLAFAGAVLTTVSAVLFVVSLLLELVGFHTSPYLGILTFLVLPAAFVVGLALIPAGAWLARRRAARGVEYVDSVGFCGSACHTPMEPQAVAHRAGPHAGVSCTSCHVGPGAPGFVRAKMGGVRRLVAVVRGDYTRPVPAPVHDLPATSGTCQRCHDPRTWLGDRLRHVPVFNDDEANTDLTEVLTMRAGGGGWARGGPQGAHWHASPDHRVEYVATDASRTTIPWVRMVDRAGRATDFAAGGADPATIPAGERRVMDCVDCHNRVGHPIAVSAARAVDEALASGLLPSIPFARREAVAALEASSASPGGEPASARARSFYTQHYPALGGDPRLGRALSALDAIEARHVFPAMKVAYASYPDWMSHTDDKGCFRCHDDDHTSAEGRTISQDCESCHRQ